MVKTSRWFPITVAAALCAGGLIMSQTQAAEAGTSSQPFGGQLLKRIKENMALTDTQISQIKNVLKPEKDNLASLAKQLHEARSGMRQAIRASDATEASVRAAAAKVAAAQSDMAVERMKLYSQISPILTAEQKEKLAQFESRVDAAVEAGIERISDNIAEYNTAPRQQLFRHLEQLGQYKGRGE